MLWLIGALGLTGGGIGVAALLGGGPWMLLAAKWLLGWLKHATFLQVACAALIIALGIDHGALLMSHWHSAKVEAQLAKAVQTLQRISSAQNTQATVTKTNIVTVTKTIHDAEGKARKVETAPLPGNCKTPDAVRQADL